VGPLDGCGIDAWAADYSRLEEHRELIRHVTVARVAVAAFEAKRSNCGDASATRAGTGRGFGHLGGEYQTDAWFGSVLTISGRFVILSSEVL
jgi:hypothetical protein